MGGAEDPGKVRKEGRGVMLGYLKPLKSTKGKSKLVNKKGPRNKKEKIVREW